jgi:hypothetical protein
MIQSTLFFLLNKLDSYAKDEANTLTGRLTGIL